MIYSRWRPDTGGYDYFETDERYALADDLPTPGFFGGSPIGVASVLCGRKIPANARPVGSGKVARGVIAPIDRSGLSGDGVLAGAPGWVKWLGITVGLGALIVWGYPKWKESA